MPPLVSQMGADATVQMSVLQPPAQVAAALTVAAGAPSGVDAVIDCAGFESTMQASRGREHWGSHDGVCVLTAAMGYLSALKGPP